MKLTIKLDINGIHIHGDIGLMKQLNNDLYKYVNSIINNKYSFGTIVEIYDSTFKVSYKKFSIFSVYRNVEDFSNKINRYLSILNTLAYINIVKNNSNIEDIEFDLLDKVVRINNNNDAQIQIEDLTKESIIIRYFHNLILIYEDNKYDLHKITEYINELYSSVHKNIYSKYLTIISEQENAIFEILTLNVEDLTYRKYRLVDNIYDAVIHGILGVLFNDNKILKELANLHKLKLF